MKRIMASVVSLFLLITAIPFCINVANAETLGDFEYRIYEDKAIIYRYTGNEKNVVVPSAIAGCPVTIIGSEAFYECDLIEKVTLPSSVNVIGEAAFMKCKNLKSINIPDGVTEICERTFIDCISLRTIDIPNSVTEIGGRAFMDCAIESITIPHGVKGIKYKTFYSCFNLKNATIPNTITEIGNHAFFLCTSLDTISIPDGVISIGEGAFWSCNELKEIFIPASVAVIKEEAFRTCDKLISIDVDENNSEYASVDGVLLNKDKTSLIQYPNGNSNKTYTIPDGVERIERYAFLEVLNLENIIIPNSCLTLLSQSIKDCENIKAVAIPNNVMKIDEYAIGYKYGINQKIDDFTIYANKGTAAETYALENGFDLKPYANFKSPSDSSTIESAISSKKSVDKSDKTKTQGSSIRDSAWIYLIPVSLVAIGIVGVCLVTRKGVVNGNKKTLKNREK